MSDVVQVEIELLGRHFTIGTPQGEQETLLEAVRLLEGKISTIQQHGKVMDADKIAIMAALNIAHDLLKTKVGEGLEMAAFQRKIRDMGEAADNALRQSQQPLF
ncbi:cell division protein ZapA [Chromobacterium subtsugae]|uniref:Cell division protein ZapA n=1 Tax=Chromobacterium subtsugae TaxID=251747 RepID=A0ABS7FIT3_9NEIS|nr:MULTISPECIES: cell division protein ZapA [Chromobacterium]KUM04380.1 cell division protein ZapA [Chromobacterium subtsugae]KZE87397.1 cell division protein ZapA [Chromobacterium sp. F49]MBW7566532.1 cell division protein ZapA [Chromobacterium subtsugae]MBW8289901.1 cell division protein ZapA [Chromobacterium subtsugae]OBU87315.1 cell division protein ZapA [Chromobacterium subtsugae]